MSEKEPGQLAWEAWCSYHCINLPERPHHPTKTALAAVESAIRADEQAKVANWMIAKSYATGHGDTIEDMLNEMEWQIRESERAKCAEVATDFGARWLIKSTQQKTEHGVSVCESAGSAGHEIAAAIHALGSKK